MGYLCSGKALLISREFSPPASSGYVYMGLLRSYITVPSPSRLRLRLNSLERVNIDVSSAAQETVSRVEVSQCILLFLLRMLWFSRLSRVLKTSPDKMLSWLTWIILLDHREGKESGKSSPVTQSSRRARLPLKNLPSKMISSGIWSWWLVAQWAWASTVASLLLPCVRCRWSQNIDQGSWKKKGM